MRTHHLWLGIIGIGLSTTVSIVHAGAPGSATAVRTTLPPRVCDTATTGGHAGMSCTEDNQCPNGSCVVDYITGAGTSFTAWVTLMVDENVSKFDGSQTIADVVSVTALVEVKFRGKKHLLSQTYQNLEGGDWSALTAAMQQGPYLADTGASGNRVTESRLNSAVTTDPPTTNILDDLLWQNGDSEMVSELRAIFGVTGTPVVVSTPLSLNTVDHTPHGADGLASVVRMKVKVRFVPAP